MTKQLTGSHLAAKQRVEDVLTPDELRAKIAKHQAEAQKSLSLALGMMRLDNPSFKVFTAAIEHCRAGELAMDMAGDYARRLGRLSCDNSSAGVMSGT